MQLSPRGAYLVILLALIWGTSYPLIKIASEYASPVIISIFRVLVSSVFFLFLTKGKMAVGKNELLVGILNVALFMLLLNFGTSLSPNPGLASVMIYTQPIFVVIIERLLGSKLRFGSILGVIIGMVGIIVTVSFVSFNVGTMVSLVGGLTWASGTVLFSRRIPNANVAKLNAFMSLVSIPILVPFLPLDFYFKVTPFSLAILISLALLAQAGGYTVWFNMVKQMGSVTASASSLLVPITSYLMTFLILRQAPSLLQVIGSLITLMGVYISLNSNKI